MQATIYKKLSNEKTILTVEAGYSIEETFSNLDLDNAVIVVNGKVESKDYILQEKDIVMIRITPSGLSVMAIGLIVTAVVAVGAGIAGGIALYKAREARLEAERELEKMKKFSNKGDIDNRPFLRGATNAMATGNSQPYIIGKHFFTPYLLSNSFYKITGEDGVNQYNYTALECGFNKQILKTLAIDDIIIKKFKDKKPQQGAYLLDSGIFAEEGQAEIIQDGGYFKEMPELNYKTVSNVCNDPIPFDTDVKNGKEPYLTYTLDPHARDVSIAITFPYGLYAKNDNGDNVITEAYIIPEFSLDGGKTWTSFRFDVNGVKTQQFRKNTTKEIRYVAYLQFNPQNYMQLRINAQNAIYIRIRNASNSDSRISNKCYCLFYQSVCFDPNKSNNHYLSPCLIVEDRERAYCTMLGVKLKASKVNKDKLKKINIISQGVARTWNGSKWSEEKTATRNPAAWALEILTSPTHPFSRYDDSEIDLESFGEFYEYCEKQGFKFDWIITQNTKKDNTLNHIMEATGACIYTDIYGRRAVAIDKPQENALAVYNPQNVISLQNRKTFGRRTDGLRIKYVNSRNDLYQEDTYLVMREVDGIPLKLNENSIIKDVKVTGITEHSHIVKHARRLMAIEALRPKTTIIEVGNEGVFYTPFSKVLIQDDSLKIGKGHGTIRECVWKSGLLKKIYLHGTVDFADETKAYGIIVNCFTEDRVKPVAIKVSGTGETDELTVLSRIRQNSPAIPESGNVLSFGELDANGEFTQVTTPYIISQIKRRENGFTLELVNYHEAIYDSGTIPDYTSNITPITTPSNNTIPQDTMSRDEVTQLVNNVSGSTAGVEAAKEAANLILHGTHYSNVHRIPDVDICIDELIAKMDEDARNAAAAISVTEDSIILKVEDKDKNLRSYIALEKDKILQAVEDKDRQLESKIAIQSTAIQGIVEGGGSSGRLSLSLELPATIDEATRSRLISSCSAELVQAVYAPLAGTSYYAIKKNASMQALKKLWTKAVKAGLIASQIELDADQIVVKNGDNVAAAFEDGKLKAEFIDAQRLVARQLKVDTDKNSNQDFEAEINKEKGLLIRNKNEEILKVDPHTGESFFTGKVNAGAVQLLDSGVFIRDGEVSIENNGWKACMRPCNEGVEFVILGGDGGQMKKRQLFTTIAGGILNLFVLGNITSCGNIYQDNTGAVKNGWERKTQGERLAFIHIENFNNIWVLLKSDNTILVSNDNGNNWTEKFSKPNKRVFGIAFNGNTWVTVGEKGTIFSSNDNGNSWQQGNYTSSRTLHKTVGNGNAWVAIGDPESNTFENSIIVSSDNGNTWESKYSAKYTHYQDVACSSNTWVVVGYTHTHGEILVSNDNGNNWSKKFSLEANYFQSVIYHNNIWIATAYHPTNRNVAIFLSDDNGNTWNKKFSYPSDMFIISMVGNNNTLVALCLDNLSTGKIIVSHDNGNNWNITYSEKKLTLNSVACRNDVWVAVGSNNTILVSADNGCNWHKKYSEDTTASLKSVAYHERTWIAVGDDSILTSTDTALFP